MEIRSCRKCRKLYHSTGKDRCPECLNELEKQFEAVKNMIYKFPDCTREELIEETGVEEADILAWIKEGRLTVSTSSNLAIKCASCGKRISSGRYCPACTKEMVNTLEKGASAIRKENANVFIKNDDTNTRQSKDRMHSRESK